MLVVEHPGLESGIAGEYLAVFDTLQPLRVDVGDPHALQAAARHAFHEAEPFALGERLALQPVYQQDRSSRMQPHFFDDRAPIGERVLQRALAIHLDMQLIVAPRKGNLQRSPRSLR